MLAWHALVHNGGMEFAGCLIYQEQQYIPTQKEQYISTKSLCIYILTKKSSILVHKKAVIYCLTKNDVYTVVHKEQCTYYLVVDVYRQNIVQQYILPPFLNVSLFRDFTINYIWMYIDIFQSVESLILLRMQSIVKSLKRLIFRNGGSNA